jgi:hypothetical protein
MWTSRGRTYKLNDGQGTYVPGFWSVKGFRETDLTFIVGEWMGVQAVWGRGGGVSVGEGE